MTTPNRIRRWGAPALAGGMTAAAGAWAVAFIVHLPGVELSTGVGVTLIALAHAGACFLTAKWAGKSRSVPIGIGSGLVAGILDLMVLGAIIADAKANQAIIVPGFLLATVLLGGVAGVLARAVASTDQPGSSQDEQSGGDSQTWLSRIGWATVLTTLCLLLVGGTVTSSNAGMAVPDYPGTYGHNMLLYPLSLMAADSMIYLEHAHRLFGMLVGLCTVLTAIAITTLDPRRWVKVVAWVLVVLVIVQGLMGGARVLKESEFIGVAHGVLGQVFFGMLIAQAIWLSPLWMSARNDPSAVFIPRMRRVATGFVHLYLLQLLTGGVYRHLANTGVSEAITHSALGLHILGSLAVVVMAMLTAASAIGHPGEGDPRRRRLGLTGQALYVAVVCQFLLGWVTLFVVLGSPNKGKAPTSEQLADVDPVPAYEAIIPTMHQGLGATLLGLGVFILIWSRAGVRAQPANAPASPAEADHEAPPPA